MESRQNPFSSAPENISGGRPAHIVMLTPEAAPAAKVGGLGDMVVGLAHELARRGNRVEVVCPAYGCLRHKEIEDERVAWEEVYVPHFAETWREMAYQGRVSGVDTFMVTGSHYFNRAKIYGYDDDIARFAYFCRAALEFLAQSGRRPDILHVHDWSTALAPVMLCDIFAQRGLGATRSVLTIHNNECQGQTADAAKIFGMAGLDAKNYHTPDRLQDETRPACLNLLKGGIVYSNFVTAVSPTYAGEIMSPLGGRGLQGVLSVHAKKVGGVLNGIDYAAWDPAHDPHIAFPYGRGADFNNKYRNKYALRERVGLADAWKPIVCVITRLTAQKGLDLIRHALHRTLTLQGQFVLLGVAPDPAVDEGFRRLRDSLADHPDVSLRLEHDEALARLVYAGSDILVVPSLYEPCGLTQLIAMRYGTVPVVRQTGGLADTVFDADFAAANAPMANGFVFRDPDPQGLESALDRAIQMWFDRPDDFTRLIDNGMSQDWSWKGPARDYENIYRHIQA